MLFLLKSPTTLNRVEFRDKSGDLPCLFWTKFRSSSKCITIVFGIFHNEQISWKIPDRWQNHWTDETLDKKQLMTSGCGSCYVSTPWCAFRFVPRNTVASNNIMLRAITCVYECKPSWPFAHDCVVEQRWFQAIPSQLVQANVDHSTYSAYIWEILRTYIPQLHDLLISICWFPGIGVPPVIIHFQMGFSMK